MMNFAVTTAALVAAVSAVSSFGTITNTSSTVSYSTSYWTECSGSTIGTGLRTGTAVPPGQMTETATDITTQTYCPSCLHTTVYSTAYEIYCPTGVTTQGYIVTAVTSGVATPTWSNIPPGFTSKMEICTVCGPETITQIMTYPVTTVPYQAGMSGAPAAPVAPEENPAPAETTPVAVQPVCPGPQCQGGYATPTAPIAGNNTGTQPYKGTAASLSLGAVPVLIALGALFL